MNRQIDELPDGMVYLDTMVLYIYLRNPTIQIDSLFQRIEDGMLQAFTASLTFDELALLLIWLARTVTLTL